MHNSDKLILDLIITKQVAASLNMIKLELSNNLHSWSADIITATIALNGSRLDFIIMVMGRLVARQGVREYKSSLKTAPSGRHTFAVAAASYIVVISTLTQLHDPLPWTRNLGLLSDKKKMGIKTMLLHSHMLLSKLDNFHCSSSNCFNHCNLLVLI